MNKSKTFICIFFLSYIVVFSQKCLSSEYLETYKSINPLLENKIKTTIDNFVLTRKLEKQKNTVSGASLKVFNQITTIPVVFNIIHNGELQGNGRNLSDSKIQEQIDIMNSAYSGVFGGVDTNIRFCLAQKNSLGQETTGINRFLGSESYDLGESIFGLCAPKLFPSDTQIKGLKASGFPNNLYLNIWTTDLKLCGSDGIAGYSSFPYYLEVLEEFNDINDGVVVDYKYVGVNSNTNSHGMTAVHEIGHWLGLFHIFEDNDTTPCNSTSCHLEEDLICDTESVPDQGIHNIAPGDCMGYNCSGQLTTIVQNFMDYQPTARLHCQRSFTEGQKDRMTDILTLYRASIYNQGVFGSIACGSSPPIGGGGNSCNEDFDFPVQKIFPPNIGVSIVDRKFGERLEVNDEWLVTIDRTRPGSNRPDYIHIYKREGCFYALHQSLELPMVYYANATDFGLILNKDEIIISTYQTDSVYIYKLNESTNTWYLNQHIQNNSNSDVGTSTYLIGEFLFILENNLNINNIFRIYRKDNTGNYSVHQTLSTFSFNLPTLERCIESGNFIENEIPVNPSNPSVVYDPPELLVYKRFSSTDFLLLTLNSSHRWVVENQISSPNGIPNSETIFDIEISKDFIYILTKDNPGNNIHGIVYLYSYKKNLNNSNPFSASYKKLKVYESPNNVFSDSEIKIYNDQFLLIDGIRSYPLRLFYNQNFSSVSSLLPDWQEKFIGLPCNNPGQIDGDEFELFGNILYYGVSGFNSQIRIYDMKDVMDKVNYSSSFISNSDFFNKQICAIPNDYSTFSERITIGGQCELEFNHDTDKEFIAKESITLKEGTIISADSNITFRVEDNICNSIISSTSKTKDIKNGSNNQSNDFEFENLATEDKILVYPNPTNGVSTIENLTEESIIDIKIHSVTGHSTALFVKQGISSGKTLDIDLSRFNSGIYILRLILSNNEIIYKKIIKE